MRNIVLKGALGLAAVTLAVQPVHAGMKCWNAQQVSAVKVRDLQSRLMVASLRCRAMGIDVLPAYNSFVKGNKVAIQSANDTIKKQFAAGYGAKAGQAHYDRFTTSLANAYGGDATNRDVCNETREFAKEASDARGNSDMLVKVADRMGKTPSVPGGRCR